MLKNKKILWGFCILTSAVIFVIYKYKTAQYLASTHNMEDPVVAVAKTKIIKWRNQISIAGSVKAEQGVMVSAQVNGMIEHIYFSSGQTVKAGDVLLTLENNNEQANLKNAQAKWQLTQSNYHRYEKLYNKKIIAPADLDNIRSQWQQAQANVQQEQALLDKTIIRAPFGGVLGISQVNLGEYLTAGQAVVSLQMLNPIFIDFSVAEKFIRQVQLGTLVQLTTNSYPGKIFNGRIIAVDPAIDIGTRSMNMRAEVINSDHQLLPGMFVSVQLPLGKVQSLIAVPQTAITYSPAGEAIFIAQQNKALLRYVHVLAHTGDLAMISGKVKAGELVITAGQLNLYDGANICISPTH